MFSTSELSILQARKEISNFGLRIEKMFLQLQSMFTEAKSKKYYKLQGKIEKGEQITDDLEQEISLYLTNVAEGELSHYSSKKIKLHAHQNESLQELFELILEAFKEMNLNLDKGFSEVDTERAYLLEEKINEKRDQIRQQHVEDLKEKKYKHKTGAYYGDLFSLSERIGDYILNVSEAFKEYQETP